MIFCVMNEFAERREGLKALLRQVNRQATALDARDWRQAESILAHTEPDLLVIDWHSPTMQPRDLSCFLRDHPNLPAAVLADDATGEAVATFMQAGVRGVVPRDLAPRLIVRALELVLLGGHYIPARALDLDLPDAAPYRARHTASIQSLPRRPNFDGPSPLSPRQLQIMRLVHLGNTNKVIARALGISEGTVKIHLASMFRMLGATNRAAAVAIYNGWQFDNLRVLSSRNPATAINDATFAKSKSKSKSNSESESGSESESTAHGAEPKSACPAPKSSAPPATREPDPYRHWLFAAEADVCYQADGAPAQDKPASDKAATETQEDGQEDRKEEAAGDTPECEH